MKTPLTVLLAVLLLSLALSSAQSPDANQIASLNYLRQIYGQYQWVTNAGTVCKIYGISCDSANNIISITISQPGTTSLTSASTTVTPKTTTSVPMLDSGLTGGLAVVEGGYGNSLMIEEDHLQVTAALTVQLTTDNIPATGSSTTLSSSGTSATATTTANSTTSQTTGATTATTTTNSTATGTGVSTTSSTTTTTTGATTASTNSTATGTGVSTTSSSTTIISVTTGSTDPIDTGNFTFPMLKTLKITQPQMVTTVGILSLINNLSNLTSLVITNHNSLVIPSNLSTLTSLFIVGINNCGLTTFPSAFLTLAPTLKYMDFSNNSISSMPSIPEGMTQLRMDNNALTNLNDNTFCTIFSFSFNNNNISSLASCFVCYWSFAKTWLTGNPVYSTTVESCSTPALNYPTSDVVVKGQIITIKAPNYDGGWTWNASPGLNAVIPNKQYTYTVPDLTITKSSSTILKLSPSISVQLTFIFGNPFITSCLYSQLQTGIQTTVNGNFIVTDPNKLLFSLGSTAYTVTRSNTSLTLTLPNTITEGKIPVNVSTEYGIALFTSLYVRSYPIVTSTSVNKTTIMLYGSFRSSNLMALREIPDIQEITINGNPVNTTNATMSNTAVAIPIPSDLPSGTISLTVNQDGYIFQSNSVLYIPPSVFLCNAPCLNGGTCVLGSCNCPAGYSGPQCEYSTLSVATESTTSDQSKNAVITSNERQQGSMTYKNIQLNFQVYSIQELNFNGDPVDTYLTHDQWILNQDSTDSYLLYTSQGADEYENLTVSVVIELFKTSQEYEFANQTFSIDPNSIKISVNVTGWQYQSSLNNLQIVLKTNYTATGDCEDSDPLSNLQVGNSTGANIKYLSVQSNGVAFYGRFLEVGYSDGRLTYSSNRIIQKDQSSIYIGIQLPQCQVCVIDPNYALLLDPNAGSDAGSCSTPNNSRKWVLPVAVAVPVFVVAASIIIFVVVKKKFYFYRSGKTFKIISRSNRSSSSSISMHSR